MMTYNPKDDLENQQLKQEQLNFLQKYQDNITEINYLETSMRYFQITSIFAGLVFLIFFATVLLLDKPVMYAYIYLSLPFIIGIISLILTINFFLKLTIVLDESSLASYMSYFSINLAGINFIIFIILFTLKMESVINIQWKIITIPLYVVIGIGLFYFIFMMPAFIDKMLYWELGLLSVFILNTLIFLILLNSRLDNSLRLSYVIIFVPVWLTIGLNYVYQIQNYTKGEDRHDTLSNLINLIVNSLLTIAFVLIALNLDKVFLSPYVISYVLIIFSYVLFFTDRFLIQFNISMYEKKK